MLSKSITRSVSMLAVLGLLSAGLVGGASATVKQREMEKEGVMLIGQVEDVARDVRYNADRLSSLIGSTLISRWTHNHHLAQMKSLVNEGLRPALQRLTEIQPQLAAWHQDAIDQMLDSAKALAADTNSAILSQRDTGTAPLILNAEYAELIDRVKQHADALVKTADAAGEYAAVHRQAIEAGLNVPGHR
jgi:hypothetical protein